MKTIYEDPRLTAYVLGEMNERDKTKFEQEIHDSPDLARAVEEMKESASLFSGALPLEAADLGLSMAQRDKVHRAMSGEKKPTRRWAWLPQPFSPAGSWAGATLVLCLGAWLWVFTDAMNTNHPNPTEMGVLKPVDQKKEVWSGIRLDEEAPEEAKVSEKPLGDELLAQGATEPLISSAPAASDVSVLSSNLSNRSIVTPSAAPALPAVTTAPTSAAAVAGASGSSSGYGRAAGEKSKDQLNRVDERSRRQVEKVKQDTAAFGIADADYSNDFRDKKPETRAEAPGEAYEALRDNAFKRVADIESGTSTFGADVDTASYSNVRRFLQDGQLPPRDAVRIEELLNYFPYDYPRKAERGPFATSVEIASAPWAPQHRLVRVGLRAQDVAAQERPPMNLVFLVDVSGSMSSENKLPLVQKALKLLTRNLEKRDRVAIVVYAGSTGLVLDSTADKAAILEAIDRMQAGGSTNGEGGIRLAYRVAAEHYRENGINRVILCTDGDFNVGVTDREDLVSLIERKRKEGVFLNIYGFGMGNLKDATLEQLADKGNGAYGYIDSFAEARKAFVEQLSGTLVTVAKDVKFQIEFNPAQVAAWRQIGYENRQLARQDFNDDTKDAGEVGAGHTVTVLYEIVPAGGEIPSAPEAHRYLAENRKPETGSLKSSSNELLFLKIRYKEPKEDESKLQTFAVKDGGNTWQKASPDFKFAASVASFGMLLRESPHAGASNWGQVLALGRAGLGEDPQGYRSEYLRLVETARDLSGIRN
ncbi:MAG: VWA domain-containing protein [Candidatus Methylacidiphilales bacterium]|nr:VWA domain-containing protein [Candidatus Methylacidiphilales bacterium]